MVADETLYREAIGWRRRLHGLPETGFEEQHTSAFVAERLAAFGLEVHRDLGGTGVLGVLRGGSANRAIGLRADMDALNIHEANSFDHRSTRPGKMHACGHDGHTAMLLGAAKALAGSPGLDGVICFIFQPAEEHGRGAQAMIADGLFERFPVEEVHGLHNWPHLPAGAFATRVGPLMASEDNFEIVVQGVGGHAARPHKVRDPIVAAAQIVGALQTVVGRSLDPLDSGVVSVTEILTDGTRNVIPSTVTLKGDTRSFSAKVQEEIETAMARIVAGVCAANGVEGQFRYTREFKPLVTTAEATAAALRAAGEVFERVEADC
ncbi:MAG TPA: amidohydrolase, partial [Caulobacteraceae bacterium]|nr:amidohydrolase [Caulobacteraceae bacterium]